MSETSGEEQAEAQPSSDPSVFHEGVDPAVVGQPTEEPRPDPTKPKEEEQAEEE
jgi:hypothetical protein